MIFSVSFFFGILKNKVKKWIGAQSELHNELAAGEADIISLAPAKALRNLATLVLTDSKLTESWMALPTNEYFFS